MSLNSRSQITDPEADSLVALIEKCEPGDLPRNVFEAVAKIAVYPAIEFVLLRKNKDEVEVLLFQRDPDDPVWPSQYHTPGTILRPTDSSLEEAINRLINDELQGVTISEPQFTGVYINKYLRGPSLGIEYCLEVSDNPSQGVFYPVDALPDNFISEQKDLLARAVKAFTRNKYSQ